MKKLFITLSLILGQILAYADQEAGNSIYVTAEGAWYAKSVPASVTEPLARHTSI